MRALKAVEFAYQPLTEVRQLLQDFRAMLNLCLGKAVELRTVSLSKLHRCLYRQLKAGWPGYHSQYYVTAYRVASQILRSWKRKKRRRPVAEKLFVRLHKRLFKLEGWKLRVCLKVGKSVILRLAGGDYQRAFLEAHERGELRVGEVLLKAGRVVIPFWKKAKPVEPRGAIAFDLNESCLVSIDEEGRVAWIDLKPARTIHTEYFKKRRRIQQKVKDGGAKQRLLKKYAGREKRRVRDVLHKAARRAVDLAAGRTMILEDLTGLRQGLPNRGKMLNRRLCSWNYRQLQAYMEYKARWRGLSVVRLPARGTSKRCRCGGTIAPRQRACPRCGLDRHLNACLNLLGMWGVALAPKASPEE